MTASLENARVAPGQNALWDMGPQIVDTTTKIQNLQAIIASGTVTGPGYAALIIQLDQLTQNAVTFGNAYNAVAATTGAPLLDISALKNGEVAFQLVAGAVGQADIALQDLLGTVNAVSPAIQNAANQIAISLVPIIGFKNALATAGTLPNDIWADANRIMVETGASYEDFVNIILPAVVNGYQKVGQEQVAAATKTVSASSTAVNAVEQQFNALSGKLQGILQGALTPGVGENDIIANLLPREDAINEPARRLADLAVKGFDSPWVDYFRTQFPALWAQAFSGTEQGGDIKKQAAQLLKDFQDGLQPQLLDKDAAKERIKRMILGEQNLKTLADELAGEVSQEMGLSLGEAKAATAQALGLGATSLGGQLTGQAGSQITQTAQAQVGPSGNAAAVAFVGGFTTGLTENQLGDKTISTLAAQMKLDVNMKALDNVGRQSGTVWGGGFMAAVGENVPPALLNLLAMKILPAIQAGLTAKTTQTGAATP